MAYTRIPELPSGGPPIRAIQAQNDLLVVEQDITRKITPYTFLSNSIGQLDVNNGNLAGSDLFTITNDDQVTRNTSLNNLMYYINTHQNLYANSVFVSLSGSDVDDFPERGLNPELPYRTIKKAAQRIAIEQQADANKDNSVNDPVNSNRPKQWSIIVRSGNYIENNPIYLPPNTSLIGDNLRRTTISPANIDLDIIWVNSACYVWGFTFRGHRKKSELYINDPATGINFINNELIAPAAIAFPLYSANRTINQLAYNWAYFNKSDGTGSPLFTIPTTKPNILVSPYVQGCTSYALPSDFENRNLNDAGCGMRIDGSLVTGSFRSMVLDSFTQINQGGIGIHILNHGYAQLVSIFTVATAEGILCESGGSCSISTSNCTFGLSGLIARGMSGLTKYPTLNSDYSNLADYTNIGTPILSGHFTIMPPDAVPSATNTGYNYLYGYLSASDLFTVKETKPIAFSARLDDPSPDIIANIPYTNLCFTISVPVNPELITNEDYIMESDVDPNLPNNNRPKIFTVDLPVVKNNSTGVYGINDPNAYDIQLTYNTPKLNLRNLRGKDFSNANVYFYARSMIETGSHTFEYMGTGTRMVSAVPAYGGVAINENEAVYDGLYDTNAPGIVYFTSSNELGDFKVGPNFKIVQSTGTIEGDTFKRAIMTLVTPLNLVLE